MLLVVIATPLLHASRLHSVTLYQLYVPPAFVRKCARKAQRQKVRDELSSEMKTCSVEAEVAIGKGRLLVEPFGAHSAPDCPLLGCKLTG
jgi:hypothetical protein